MADIGLGTTASATDQRGGGEGASAAEQAQQKAQEAAGQAQEKMQEAAEQAQEKAHHLKGQLQDRLRQELEQRSGQASEQIGSQASDLRSVSESLREQGKEGPAQAAEQLAGYAERAAGYLRENDPQALLADVERFGRRQPWAVAAGGLAVGFLASRFLKASSRRRYQGLTVPRPAGVYAHPGGSLQNGAETGAARLDAPPRV
jgi:glucan phosphorylase